MTVTNFLRRSFHDVCESDHCTAHLDLHGAGCQLCLSETGRKNVCFFLQWYTVHFPKHIIVFLDHSFLLSSKPVSPTAFCMSSLRSPVKSESCSLLSDSFRLHGILQARILECAAFSVSRGSFEPRSPIFLGDSLPPKPHGNPKNTEVDSLPPFSRGSSQPRNRTWVSCTAGEFLTSWATREAPEIP